MLSDVFARVWRLAPRALKRWSMRLIHTRFTVTAGAIVLDTEDRVLLLKHRFRAGSGWGIPGGFINAGEQPEGALKRELREEVGLEVDHAKVIAARSFTHARQIEILFLCRSNGKVRPQSTEIEKADWFSVDELPAGLPRDQKRLLRDILVDGANRLD